MVLENKLARLRPVSFFPHQPETIKVALLAQTRPGAQPHTGAGVGLVALGHEARVTYAHFYIITKLLLEPDSWDHT